MRPLAETADAGMSTTDILLWDVLPYVTIAVFVVGMIWRYRYDRFGWTTRSSQLYEKPLIRIASPIFHFGILAVLMGHVVGLLIPEAWTDALGVSESTYHFFAVVLGAIAGAATLFGIAMLIYRPGLRGDDEERQDHVRVPDGRDRPRCDRDPVGRRRARRGTQLP